MRNKDGFTKTLAVIGSVLMWIPILAPVFLSVVSMLKEHIFRMDYLMPAEIFPLALAGCGLLIWAALRSHSHLKLIGWGFGLALFMLAAGQGLAVITGLASGETAPAGWPLVLVMTSLALFIVSLIVSAVGGILLVRALFKPDPLPATAH